MASGDSRSTVRAAPTNAATREPRTASIDPLNSRPSPLKRINSSPLRARSTFARCAAGLAGKLDGAPGVRARLDKYPAQAHVANSTRFSGRAFIWRELSHMLAPASVGTRRTRMWVDLETGLLRGVRQIASPNYDARPQGRRSGFDRRARHQSAARRIWRSMDREAVHQFPAGSKCTHISPKSCALRVSSHVVVARRRLTQYVRFTDRAWHAGCRAIKAAKPATISRSAWSSRGPTLCPTRPRNTTRWRRSWPRSVHGISAAVRGPPRRTQRHLAGAQNRSRPGIRLAARAAPDRRASTAACAKT